MSLVSLRTSMFLSAPVSLRKYWEPRKNNHGTPPGKSRGSRRNMRGMVHFWRFLGVAGWSCLVLETSALDPRDAPSGFGRHWSALHSLWLKMTMAANIEGLTRFTKANRGSCEIFTQGVRRYWGHGLRVKTHKVWLKYRRLLSVWMCNSLNKSTSVRRNA